MQSLQFVIINISGVNGSHIIFEINSCKIANTKTGSFYFQILVRHASLIVILIQTSGTFISRLKYLRLNIQSFRDTGYKIFIRNSHRRVDRESLLFKGGWLLNQRYINNVLVSIPKAFLILVVQSSLHHYHLKSLLYGYKIT